MRRIDCIDKLKSEQIKNLFSTLYGNDEITVAYQQNRYQKAVEEFARHFPSREDISIYSAPGRTEIGGNHTDHQRGVILAGAVNLDAVAVVAFHNDGIARVKSEGYPFIEIPLGELKPDAADNGTKAIVKGVIAKFKEYGVNVQGFDMYITSDVISGSGISSSAAFEILIGTVINCYYNDGKCTPVEIAGIGGYAENVFFGKKSGLMDQTVSAVGALVSVDFKDSENPAVEKIDYDFEKAGYTLCITDTKSSHENLTDDYVAIREEMKQVAEYFGRDVLSEVDEQAFYDRIADLRNTCPDRALLRAIHFFDETRRARQEAEALRADNIEEFLKLVNESGRSSGALLQNLYSVSAPTEQPIPLALALSAATLKGRGAARVHGGGFAGTIQAFVPTEMVDAYKAVMERVFGAGACHIMRIRPVGGTQILR